ncbi:MAG: (2Fe-2S)-binding protein [Spirochaetales bacterium]|nr:(2Fe-2S)-binding protein [Spirochaetales bacterium]
MVSLIINGIKVEVNRGATLLDAARIAGIEIPTLCFLEGKAPFTSCMICLVEDTGRGTLVPACSTPAEEGMVIETGNRRVLDSRRETLGLLISEHAGDCRAPCSRACPSGLPIPSVLRMIRKGNFRDAVNLITRYIPFPAIIGRICPAPCEKVCRLGRVEPPIAISLIERFCGDLEGRVLSPAPVSTPRDRPENPKRIAVIGAGPAGLAAAYRLLSLGYRPDIFEKEDGPGGGLHRMVSDGRLPLSVLYDEITKRLGDTAGFHYHTAIGVDLSLDELKKSFTAVLFATGEAASSDAKTLIPLRLHGPDKGFGTDFLTGEEGVFACGAAVRPMRMAVRALVHGKEAADTVHRVLTGQKAPVSTKAYDCRMGHIGNKEISAIHSTLPAVERIDVKKGSQKEFSKEEIIGETMHCLHCDCHSPVSCRLRKYATDYGVILPEDVSSGRRPWTRDSSHPEVVFEPGKCIKCGICVRLTEDNRHMRGMSFLGRGPETAVAPPFEIPVSGALGTLAVICAQSCPTGALALKESEDNDNDI